MDNDDVEIVEHDVMDNACIQDIFNDFSQVQIAVHGADVAEKILDNLSDLDAVIENDIQIVASHDPEHILSDLEYNIQTLNNSSKSLENDGQDILDYPEQAPDYNENDTENKNKVSLKGVPENDILDIPGEYPGGIKKISVERVLGDLRHNVEKSPEPDNDVMIIPDDYPDQIPELSITKDVTERLNIVAKNDILEVPGDSSDLISQDYIVKDTLVCGDDDEAQDCTVDCTDFVMIKEEVDQFEATDYTDFDEVPAEATHNDLPNHFNNKIILGTKPCLNTSKVIVKREVDQFIENVPDYVDKEILNADVVLEDCGPNLEENACFCKKCDILFSTPSALDSHKMSAHSFLVPVSNNKAVKSTAKPAFARKSTGTVVKSTKSIARKSTGTVGKNTKSVVKSTESSILISKFCNHCNKVFTDHNALIQHLYELVPLKSFKCNKCDLLFNTQKDLVNHSTVHIKTEKTKIKKEKIENDVKNSKKKILFEEDIKKKTHLSPKKEVNLIPLSAVFQCTKCNLHMLGAFAGWQHCINCNGQAMSKKIVTCKICKRKLRDVDVDTHRKQHEICTKFKVFKLTRNLFERTLCRCPKCGVHFNELTIQAHYKRCGKLPTAHCQLCNILIPKTNLDSHTKKHEKNSLRAKDFVIIQYFIRNKPNMKRKLKPIATPTKKIKLENPTNKIKAATPNQGKITPKIIGSKINKEHIQKKLSSPKKEERTGRMVNRLKFEKTNKVPIFFCKNCNSCCQRDSRRTTHLSKNCMVGRDNKVICDECGLLFNKKTIISHKKRIHRTRDLSLHDVVFLNISNMKRIIPSLPDYPQCKDCKINFFSKTVQQEHICGENYGTCKFCGDKFDNSAYNIHVEFHKLLKTEPPRPKMQAKIMPELMKKYESLTIMRTVFSCKKCDVVTNSYDKAVEHSQDHLYNSPTLKTIKCYICNLKFEETSWSKHSDLHSRMQIGSKDFNILAYDPQNLLTEEWFKLFESLPEDQIRQITDKSMYGYERGIKMKLLKNGQADLTLYCCSKCNICFHNNEIAKHIKSPCKKPAKTNICKICQIPFNNITTLRWHEIQHVKGSKKDAFRVVSFIKEFRAQKRPYLRKELKTEKAPSVTTQGKYVIHKCRTCKTCLRRKYNIIIHRCISDKRQAECNICKELFNRSCMYKHKDEHRLKPDFNLRNTSIQYFNSPDKAHYAEDDIEDLEPAKKKVKVNTVLKPTTSVRSKLANSKADTSMTSVGTPKIAKIFKCDCGLHYTSLQTIEKHKELCSPDVEISQENCSKCGLLFPTDVLVSHLCKHHSNNTEIVVETYKNVNEESFESVESTSQSPIEIRNAKDKAKSTKRDKVKLYKCSECNIYFMVQNTCYRHIYKDHVPIDARRCIECKLCGLQFTIKTLDVHVSKHHQEELSLDDILVEEYQPKTGKGPPKIDIYIASEKVQSRQVTSSVEESR